MSPEPEPVLVIPPKVVRYRYLLTGGRTMDVDSPYGANSTDREAVLTEARRRWGGTKDTWRVEGVTTVEPS